MPYAAPRSQMISGSPKSKGPALSPVAAQLHEDFPAAVCDSLGLQCLCRRHRGMGSAVRGVDQSVRHQLVVAGWCGASLLLWHSEAPRSVAAHREAPDARSDAGRDSCLLWNPLFSHGDPRCCRRQASAGPRVVAISAGEAPRAMEQHGEPTTASRSRSRTLRRSRLRDSGADDEIHSSTRFSRP